MVYFGVQGWWMVGELVEAGLDECVRWVTCRGLLIQLACGDLGVAVGPRAVDRGGWAWTNACGGWTRGVEVEHGGEVRTHGGSKEERGRRMRVLGELFLCGCRLKRWKS